MAVVKETELGAGGGGRGGENFLVPEAVARPKPLTEKRFLKRFDSKELIQRAWEEEEGSVAYWGGKDYPLTTVYCDGASLARGFLDATSTYCPSLVKDFSMYAEKDEADKADFAKMQLAEKVKEGSGCGRAHVQHNTNTNTELTHPTHLLYGCRFPGPPSQVLKKVKAARFGINTMIDATGKSFWGWIPKKLLRRAPFNADVETIELLLRSPPDPDAMCNVVRT
jgi:hypothetical protein